jgi:hypothetical protein
MEPKRLPWLLAPLLCACQEPSASLDAGADDDDGVDDSVPQPDFEIRYRTRHVDIAPGFTQPICRGTLEQIDRHVEMVAELLDIDVQRRTTFYWFNEHANGAFAGSNDSCDWCGTSCACERSNGAIIYGAAKVMFHELTHAVVAPAWGRSDVLFEEGIAYGFDGGHVLRPRSERPSETAGGSRHGGAHFSRWLVDRYGPAKLRAGFERLGPPTTNTKEEVFAVVEDVYGLPFLDLEAEYFATAADIYPAPGLCDGLPHVPWQGDRWELRVTPDCDAPNVFGPRDEDGAMVVAVTLDLPALPPEELFAFDVIPEELHGMLTPCIEAPIHDDEDPEGFVSGPPAANPIVFPARPGRYRLDMPLPESGELLVRLCQWDGEWRIFGEPPSACVPD